MRPVFLLARFGSSRAARLIGAAALAMLLLPILPGAVLAKSYVAMSQRSITLVTDPDATHDYLSGTVTLQAGKAYSWTEGLFSPAGASVSKVYSLAEPIVATILTPQGGTYNWSCWLDGNFSLASYTSGCTILRTDLHESYSMSIGTFPSRAATLDWQVSFVQTARTKGQTVASNTFPKYQCTYGALYQAYMHYGLYPKVSGDAKYWYSKAASSGWTVTNEPESNTIVVWQPGYDGAGSPTGHVAWVEGIEYRSGVAYIHTAEMNIQSGQGSSFRYRILPGSALSGNPPGRGYILVTDGTVGL
jgi:surface antigen